MVGAPEFDDLDVGRLRPAACEYVVDRRGNPAESRAWPRAGSGSGGRQRVHPTRDGADVPQGCIEVADDDRRSARFFHEGLEPRYVRAPIAHKPGKRGRGVDGQDERPRSIAGRACSIADRAQHDAAEGRFHGVDLPVFSEPFVDDERRRRDLPGWKRLEYRVVLGILACLCEHVLESRS